ncbi:MAG: FHA domain-containing protein [Planctomycetaceae bacterium]
MKPRYAPERRKLLALQHDELSVIRTAAPDPASDAPRQLALSVPETVRSLGEPLDPFFEACGGPTAVSLAVQRTGSLDAPSTYLFRQPFVLIGRCVESDLALVDPAVGFRHLYLQYIGGRWFFVNLTQLLRIASTERGAASGWFDPGTEIDIGPYTVSHLGEPPRAPTRASATALTLASASDLPLVELELLNPSRETERRQICRVSNGITLLGACRQCDVWLRDTSVSKVHASLVLTRQGLWVVDLLGRDGVRVEGRPAYWKQIHDGGELAIGRFRFCVRIGRPGDRSSLRLAPRAAKKGLVRRRASKGISENSVLRLVEHLTQMQNRFFEHSQMQMQLMTQMLAHLERSQQAAVQKDLTRIDEISRELQSIQAKLDQAEQRDRAASVAQAQAAPLQPGPISPPAAQPAARAVQQAPATAAGAQQAAAPSSAPTEVPAPAHTQFAAAHEGSQPTADSAEAHARLTRRMAKLAQERNSRWRRVMQTLSRKPEK